MWKKALIFIGGVAVGGAVTYLFILDRMEREIESQVEDVKKVYSREEKKEEPVIEVDCEEDKPIKCMDPDVARKISLENMRMKDNLFHVEKLIVGERYREDHNIFSNPADENDLDLGDDSDDEDEEEEFPREGLADRPYTISQEEFISGNKYFDKTTLNYYDDGILEDEITQEIIDDVDAAIGNESLTKFGEYEDDVVFVRNEKLSTDYEVIRQYRDFAQIPKDDPD